MENLKLNNRYNNTQNNSIVEITKIEGDWVTINKVNDDNTISNDFMNISVMSVREFTKYIGLGLYVSI